MQYLACQNFPSKLGLFTRPHYHCLSPDLRHGNSKEFLVFQYLICYGLDHETFGYRDLNNFGYSLSLVADERDSKSFLLSLGRLQKFQTSRWVKLQEQEVSSLPAVYQLICGFCSSDSCQLVSQMLVTLEPVGTYAERSLTWSRAEPLSKIFRLSIANASAAIFFFSSCVSTTRFGFHQ